MGVFEGFAGLENGVKTVFADAFPSYAFVGYDSDDQEFVITSTTMFAYANPD